MRYLTLWLTLFLLQNVQARPIVFAPLPLSNTQKSFEDFNAMVSHLEKALGETIAFRYEKKYDDVIALFQANEIDIAYLGPLPFITLKEQFPFAKALITFHEKDGKNGYRCVLVKFAKEPLDTLHVKALKVALTQPLSTCGYTKTKLLLEKKLNLNLDETLFRYVGQHDEVALSIIRGEFMIGGMKESIARSYASLGLEILDIGSHLPGFSLVVNTNTLTQEHIDTIKKRLLTTPKEVYKTWGKDISHGMSEADEKLFEKIVFSPKNFTIPQSGNF